MYSMPLNSVFPVSSFFPKKTLWPDSSIKPKRCMAPFALTLRPPDIPENTYFKEVPADAALSKAGTI